MDDDEEFVIYINIAQKFNLKLEIEEVEQPKESSSDDFPVYAIVLISVGGVIIIA